MNIISNAIDALLSPAWLSSEERKNYQPKITISTQLLELSSVRICIKDNGPGMTDQVKTRLFEPFFTTKPLGQSTALGLAISYQIIVEKQGGELKCFSQPGEGAQFWIELPICRDSCILKKVRYDFDSEENVKIAIEQKI